MNFLACFAFYLANNNRIQVKSKNRVKNKIKVQLNWRQMCRQSEPKMHLELNKTVRQFQFLVELENNSKLASLNKVNPAKLSNLFELYSCD